MKHVAAAAAAASLLALVATTAPAGAAEVQPSICTQAIAAVETTAGLPPGLLMAIGFNEAGRRVEGRATIWPWTVNVAGKGYYFPSKAEAIAFVREQQAAGQRSMDVGCLQVNLRWHPDAFADLGEAFDPKRNATYAASFLRRLKDAAEEGEAGWATAVGRYHSATPERAAGYRANVQRYWDKIESPVVLASLGGPATAATAEPVPAVARADDPRPAVRGDDPFGLELVAYWNTPYGLLIGPRDEEGPVLDTAVRPIFEIAAPQAAADRPRAAQPQRRSTHIRRFSAAPNVQGPPEKLERRQGLLSRQETKAR